MSIRPRLVDVWTVAPCEECQFYYPSDLTEAEIAEIEEWMALTLRKLRRGAERREAAPPPTPGATT